jgi:hypothetical protein
MIRQIKFIPIVLLALVFASCEEDLILFDADNGQTAISFSETEYEIVIPEEDRTLEVPVNVTTRSDVERSFNVSINTEETTSGTSNEYTLGDIVIPAGEFTGILTVDFDFSEISGEDGEVKTLVFSVSAEGATSFKDVVTVNYFREIVCNNMELTIVSDIFATETSFSLVAADGEVIVDNFFPFSQNSLQPQTYNQSFFLEDGEYTFTIFDSFGDGMGESCAGDPEVCLTGSYLLKCSIITHASGSNGLANNNQSESTTFVVNP